MNVDARRGAALFDATLVARAPAVDAAAIRSALMRYPLMTAKVIGGDSLAGAAAVVQGRAAIVPRKTAKGVDERAAWSMGVTVQ